MPNAVQDALATAGYTTIPRSRLLMEAWQLIQQPSDTEGVPNRATASWRRLAKQLRRIVGLRRTWAALGTHLKRFAELKPPRRSVAQDVVATATAGER